MKLTICFLLFCGALYAGALTSASNESSVTDDTTSQIPPVDGIMGFGLEILLTKLDHMDHKLTELQFQMDDLQEKISNGQCSNEKPPISPTTTATTPKCQQTVFQSCKDAPANVSGVYFIRVNNVNAPFKVYCEMEKFGGGWIVLQHRYDGSVDYYRNWKQYRRGFGELDKEFWLGLEHVHQLTTARKYELLVEMRDFECNYGYARYSAFQVGSEGEAYSLKTLGSYSGTAGDGMQYNIGKKFTTKDRHNDGRSDLNFAVDRRGGWWYYFFGGSSNLNGLYRNISDDKSNWWWSFKNDMRGLSFTRMMIREL